jgi:electron transfer flavoprotein beta subunit
MKIVALLSAGLHPVSGRPCPVRVEAQAIGLGRTLGPVIGLHSGAPNAPVADYLGYGLDRLIVLGLLPGSDPVPALVAKLKQLQPDLILAGRRGQGDSDTGLLPYRVAHALGWPLVADAASVEVDGGRLVVDQARPGGERRRVSLAGPAILTSHPSAPSPPGFSAAAARRIGVEREVGLVVSATEPDIPEHPYRRRPRLIRRVSGGGKLVLDIAADQAAAEILAYLEEVGVFDRGA